MTSSPAGPSSRPGPLEGLRVIDLSRNAPGPYASMLLADLGAEVIMVAGGRAGQALPSLSRGKRLINLDLKSPSGRQALHALVKDSDVFIEGFRPGVCARLGAGYAELSALNPRLIYCSLTGYGQSGPLNQTAGHDINYLAGAGFLGAVGPHGEPPTPPLNLVADFAGGSMLAVIGVLAAVQERHTSGSGQYIDAAMIDGVVSMMGVWFEAWGSPVMPHRGGGLVGGGAPFYRCYRTSDDRYVAIGAIEPQFFAELWRVLGFEGDVPDHLDTRHWESLTERIGTRIGERTREEWMRASEGTDACLSPVLDPDEIWKQPHFVERFPGSSSTSVPPIPRMSGSLSTPGDVDLTDVTRSVLETTELTSDQIEEAISAATRQAPSTGLVWPPVD